MPSQGPFSLAAMDYLAAGWHPFPARHTSDKSKAPCLKGVIGWDAIEVNVGLVERWSKEYPNAQIGLRMPNSVIGIDIDAYDGKTGEDVARRMVLDWGPLPDTWVSTSRMDGSSGIFFFRVKDSSSFVHNAGPGVEMIRSCGRFAMVGPSWHPKTGLPYGWIPPYGDKLQFDSIPSVSDLPILPSEWSIGLKGSGVARASQSMTDQSLSEWISSNSGTGRMCAAMQMDFDRCLAEIAHSGAGSRHDTMLVSVHQIVGNATEGHSGLERALGGLRRKFREVRGEEIGSGEWYRALKSEVQHCIAEGESDDDCMCDSLLVGWNQ